MGRTRIGIAVTVTMSTLASAVLLGLLAGRLSPPPARVAVSEDAYTLSTRPGSSAGSQVYLTAGGVGGGAAVSYLKFDVTLPTGRQPRKVWLWLGRQGGTTLPRLVELTSVPDTRWRESTITAGTAPRLGSVVASVAPGRYDRAIAFDVTRVIRKTGRYAFAVTAPTGNEIAQFVAGEANGSTTGPPTITFEWDAPASPTVPPPVDQPTATPSAASSTPPTLPDPAPSTAEPGASASPQPSVTPWPGSSYEPSEQPWPSATPVVDPAPSGDPWPSGEPQPSTAPSAAEPQPSAAEPAPSPVEPQPSAAEPEPGPTDVPVGEPSPDASASSSPDVPPGPQPGGPGTDPGTPPSPDPGGDPAPEPGAEPSPVPGEPAPSPDPGAEPSPFPSPDPGAEPSPFPGTDPGPEPSPFPGNPGTEPSPFPGNPGTEPGPDPSTAPSPDPSTDPSAAPSPDPSVDPGTPPSDSPSAPPTADPGASPSTEPNLPVECVIGPRLLPTCGALWGVAPGAHTSQNRIQALYEFERRTNRQQVVYHSYHRGESLFPTAEELSITRDPLHRRVLFLNWKPQVRWGQIAQGDPRTEAYLDRLAAHIRANLSDEFFFTMNHEPENDVIPRPGSGMTAQDYAAAFRHVVTGLRERGVTNLVSVMCYMAFVPWNVKSWFEELYPGDDVVDWVAWDTYAYSDPGYGYGDFAEMMNRRSGSRRDWPGFYNWAAQSFPDKPLMLGEWGVWHSRGNPQHQSRFFDSARLQLELFPRLKALVYFESPNAEGRSSMIDVTGTGLQSFQQFSRHPAFDVVTGPTTYGSSR